MLFGFPHGPPRRLSVFCQKRNQPTDNKPQFSEPVGAVVASLVGVFLQGLSYSSTEPLPSCPSRLHSDPNKIVALPNVDSNTIHNCIFFKQVSVNII